jgi:predicted transcriptional regulator
MKRRPATNKVTAVTSTVRRIKDKSIGVNADRKEIILSRMRLNPEPIGRFDIAKMFSVHETTASTLLTELVAEGRIYRVKVGYYHITREKP